MYFFVYVYLCFQKGDGKVSAGEMEEALAGRGVGHEEIQELFTSLDVVSISVNYEYSLKRLVALLTYGTQKVIIQQKTPPSHYKHTTNLTPARPNTTQPQKHFSANF